MVLGPSVEIRTRGLLNPIQARYQTSPHPDISLFSLLSLSTLLYYHIFFQNASVFFKKIKKFLKKFFRYFFEILLDKYSMLWYHPKCACNRLGEMSERFKEPVLKTGDVKASVGSNPTLSANVSVTESNTSSTCGSTQEAEGAPLLRE